MPTYRRVTRILACALIPAAALVPFSATAQQQPAPTGLAPPPSPPAAPASPQPTSAPPAAPGQQGAQQGYGTQQGYGAQPSYGAQPGYGAQPSYGAQPNYGPGYGGQPGPAASPYGAPQYGTTTPYAYTASPALGTWGATPPPGEDDDNLDDDEPDDAEPKGKRRSVAMMSAGIVLTSLGTVGVVGGIALIAKVADRQEEDLPGPILMTVFGGTFLTLGIPFTIIGSRRVKSTEGEAGHPATVVGVGPGSVALRSSF